MKCLTGSLSECIDKDEDMDEDMNEDENEDRDYNDAEDHDDTAI